MPAEPPLQAGIEPTPFERSVLDAFLAGEDPTLQQLRDQARVCTILARRQTRVGAFVDLAVPDAAQRVSPPAMTMGDLDLQVAGLPRGATAMLFVRHGALVLLEFVTNEGEWPQDPVATRIGYLRYAATTGGGYMQVPTATRDPGTLALQLVGHKSARI
jgi:hypothetical protein